MLVRYWKPWREMETLRRQLDQVFEGLSVDRPDRPNSAWTPAIELEDTGSDLVLRAQLPGIDTQDLDIQVAKQAVAIRGEYRQNRSAEGNGLIHSEFRYGSFQRFVSLPVAVQNDQVQADYKDGILCLTLPKVAAARHAVVKVNLTSSERASEVQPEATQAPASDTEG